MNIRLSLLEILLLETALWLGLWMTNDYLATLLTLTLGAIVSAILGIALISEWIEPTKVSRRYFHIMAISLLAIVLASGFYLGFSGGHLSFLKK
jgi:thiol:disulfide interchange protein